jgi:mRNA interferase RelE/StbE
VKIVRSPRFDRAYKKLPQEVRDQFRRKPRLLVDSRFGHPSLRVKRIQGTADIWEASIDMNHRLTFQKIEGGILLRVIGPHEILGSP